MRSSALSLTALSVLVAALTACPPPPTPPPPDAGNDEACVVDTNFPTRDPTTAQSMTAGTPVQGLLCPARDDDGYQVHVDTAGSILVVSLSMDTTITNVNPGYSIFELKDGALVPVVDVQSDPDTSQGHATNFTKAHRVEEAGDYVIDVADIEHLDNGFDNTNPYTLDVQVSPDPDANEPNNLPAQATPITSGTPMQGLIATTGDEDWYSIAVSGSGQIIDAKLTVPADSGVEHVATLFAPDGITILQSAQLKADPADPTKETARIRKPASDTGAGPFLLQVKDDGNGALGAQLDPQKGQYTIDLNVIADPDANEGAAGNEDASTATTVTAGQTVTASLASFADRDVYRVTPPAGTSANAPRVLVADITFDAGQTLDESFKPQVRVVGACKQVSNNPPACDIDQTPTACPATGPIADPQQFCTECYQGPSGNSCADDRMQRFIEPGTFHIAYPLRTTQPVFVEINEFNDDAFQDGTGYTVHFDVVTDPDPGEKADDFVLQNFEFAGFTADRGNGDNGPNLTEQLLNFQYDSNNARVVPLGYNAVCADGANDGNGSGGTADTCIDTQSVPVPNPFLPNTQVDCSDVPTVQKTLTGRISYDGDRDYFVLPDVPASQYMNMDIQYSIDQPTPVELTIFVHGGNGLHDLAGSFLGNAQKVGSCSEQQGGQDACPAGSLCVDGDCWTDGDSNPPVSDDFGDDECIEMAWNVKDGPIVIEVTDNGLNDFDLNMTYTLHVTISCGCPAQCDNGQDFCQNG